MGNIFGGETGETPAECSAEPKTPSVHFKQISEMEMKTISLDEITQPPTIFNLKTAISNILRVKVDFLSIIDYVTIREDKDIIKPNSTVEVLVNAQSRTVPAQYKTDDTCIVDGEISGDPRVKMTCGHAITQENLYWHCLFQMQQCKTQFECPECKPCKEWEFDSVVERGDFSEDERIFLSRKLNRNVVMKDSNLVRQCPECLSFCERRDTHNKCVECHSCKRSGNRDYRFCWLCYHPWRRGHVCYNDDFKPRDDLNYILQNCGTVRRLFIPKKRLCPNTTCRLLIEHAGGCRRMVCPSCKTVFCFRCLQMSHDGKEPDCCRGGLGYLPLCCSLAPIQRI